MNDFTKEELMHVADFIWRYFELNDDTPHGRLWDKIQLMIDNYCEHNSREVTTNDDIGIHVACKQCGKIYE